MDNTATSSPLGSHPDTLGDEWAELLSPEPPAFALTLSARAATIGDASHGVVCLEERPVIHPRCSAEDVEWLEEIDAAEDAIEALIRAKRATLAASPVREQVLWVRHSPRLLAMKRKLDAVAL